MNTKKDGVNQYYVVSKSHSLHIKLTNNNYVIVNAQWHRIMVDNDFDRECRPRDRSEICISYSMSAKDLRNILH